MTGPTRFQVPLPEVVRPPRVGRLRLGEKTAKGYPKSVDYFRVEADESGVTSEAAAAAFHSVYGETPRNVRIQIPGHTIEDILDQAYRRYSAGGLQRQCQGPGGMASVKSQTGAWQDVKCACEAEGLDPNADPADKQACELNWSFSFLLPDVSGIGIWDIASGSTMSRDAVVGFLKMMLNLRGAIALLECDMRVVMKTGRAGALVPTIELSTHDATPREMIAASKTGEKLELPEITPGALDVPEPTIHKAGFNDSPAAQSGPSGARAAAAGGETRFTPGRSDDAVDGDEILRENTAAQIRFLSPPLKERLKAVCVELGVKPTRDGLIERWGKRAQDLERLVDDVEAELNLAAQETLEGTIVE